MESSGTSTKTANPVPDRWSKIIGFAIAFLTLTLPVFIIAYYSSSSTIETIPRTANYQQQNLHPTN